MSVPEAATQTHTVPLPDGAIELQWSAVTHRGRRRDVNQDAVLAEYPLFVVADGMGGHIGGEIASASAVDFPPPEAPLSATTSPGATVRLSPSTAAESAPG